MRDTADAIPTEPVMYQFAKYSGPLWRYRVGQALFVSAVAMSVAFFSMWQGNPAHLSERPTTALYLAVCFACVVWWIGALRCPACGTSPAWHCARHGDASTFADRLLAAGQCPACGFSPGTKEGRRGRVFHARFGDGDIGGMESRFGFATVLLEVNDTGDVIRWVGISPDGMAVFRHPSRQRPPFGFEGCAFSESCVLNEDIITADEFEKAWASVVNA